MFIRNLFVWGKDKHKKWWKQWKLDGELSRRKASRMGGDGTTPYPEEGQICFTCKNEVDRFTCNSLTTSGIICLSSLQDLEKQLVHPGGDCVSLRIGVAVKHALSEELFHFYFLLHTMECCYPFKSPVISSISTYFRHFCHFRLFPPFFLGPWVLSLWILYP